MDVTPQMITNLIDEGKKLRSKVEQSKGRLEELIKQRDEDVLKLKELNTTPEDAEEYISKLTEECKEKYNEALSVLEELKKNMLGGADSD